LCHPLRDLGVTYTVGSSMARWKARGRLPIGDNSTFSLALTVKALLADIGQNFLKGGSLWAQISGGRGSSTNDFWRQKTTVPDLSRGVVCVILRLAVLIQYRRVTDRQTNRQTDPRWCLLPAQKPRPNFTKFSVHVDYLSSQLGLPLTAMQYVMYFRFCGSHHFFT